MGMKATACTGQGKGGGLAVRGGKDGASGTRGGRWRVVVVRGRCVQPKPPPCALIRYTADGGADEATCLGGGESSSSHRHPPRRAAARGPYRARTAARGRTRTGGAPPTAAGRGGHRPPPPPSRPPATCTRAAGRWRRGRPTAGRRGAVSHTRGQGFHHPSRGSFCCLGHTLPPAHPDSSQRGPGDEHAPERCEDGTADRQPWRRCRPGHPPPSPGRCEDGTADRQPWPGNHVMPPPRKEVGGRRMIRRPPTSFRGGGPESGRQSATVDTLKSGGAGEPPAGLWGQGRPVQQTALPH